MSRSYASEQIKLLVWSGLRSQKESRRIVLEDCFRPEDVTAADATWVGEEVARVWSAKLEEERSWPTPTDWDRLDAAFASLRAGGIIALHQAGYEPSDGPPMVAEEYHARGVEKSGLVGFCFYHWQCIERALEGHGLRLACGDIGGDPQRGVEIARRVVAAVEAASLRTAWDGTIDDSIRVDMRWQKRSPMLRAELESGAIRDDPSEGVLLELLSGIERGDEAFLGSSASAMRPGRPTCRCDASGRARTGWSTARVPTIGTFRARRRACAKHTRSWSTGLARLRDGGRRFPGRK